MDPSAFEATLKADGYTEITKVRREPGPANSEHTHPFSACGLVLDGAFTVTAEDVARTYRKGEIFEVACGQRHFEQVGEDGAHLIVGRKF